MTKKRLDNNLQKSQIVFMLIWRNAVSVSPVSTMGKSQNLRVISKIKGLTVTFP